MTEVWEYKANTMTEEFKSTKETKAGELKREEQALEGVQECKKTNNQTKTAGQFKSNEQTLRHKSTKDEYKHYNRENKRMKQTKTGERMSKEQTETQKCNRKEQTLRTVQEQRTDTITKEHKSTHLTKVTHKNKMTEQTWVKGVEKYRTNNSTREYYKIAKQVKTQKNNSSKERKEMSTRVHNKQNQSTRRQDDWTNIKTQEYKSKEQTLWHRNTGVQNRQKQRVTRGENKQKKQLYKSAEQTSRHRNKKPEALEERTNRNIVQRKQYSNWQGQVYRHYDKTRINRQECKKPEPKKKECKRLADKENNFNIIENIKK